MESLPSRSSDAGPESKDPGYDWRDYLDFAGEAVHDANRAEWNLKTGNADRVRNIERAIEHLLGARKLLCR